MAKTKCRFGKLKSPVRNADGVRRVCKLKKKSAKGRSQDRKKVSKEFHERRNAAKKNCRRVKSGKRKGLCKKK